MENTTDFFTVAEWIEFFGTGEPVTLIFREGGYELPTMHDVGTYYSKNLFHGCGCFDDWKNCTVFDWEQELLDLGGETLLYICQ